ncbi:type II secretion system protein, partial [bacterium]|nr:type II secretion system protein [bacterium]
MERKKVNHGISRLGLLPQHVKFPSPLVGEGLGVRCVLAMGKHTAIETISLPCEGGLGWVPSRKGKRAAFTLAEVLITLAVIGVVAAMTLPTLIAKINEKADSNQKAVIEAKLIQGLNMLDLHGGMNDTYSSTAEFVEELGKYMKITA